MMSTDEEQGLDELYRDVMEPDLPPVELLARYAQEPNTLSEDERRQVEEAQRSAIVTDELDTLRNFDFAALRAEQPAGATIVSLWAWARRAPLVPLALAASLAAVLFYGTYDRSPDTPQRIAEERAGERPLQDQSSLEPSGVPEIEDLLADAAAGVPEPVQPIDEAPSGELEARESASEIAGGPANPRPVPREQPDSTQSSEPEEMVLAMLMPEYTMPSGTLSVSRAPVVYRKPESSNPELTALAPPHVARASGSTPTLPWHVDRIPEEGAFYLTILEEDGEPVVENRLLDQPAASGVQRISLARLDISLPAGVELRWSVAHRLEEESPPTDYSFGWIEVVEAGSAEHDCVEGARLADRPAACARLGYWYDAIEATLQLESRFPGDDQPQAALRLLLKQAELAGIEP